MLKEKTLTTCPHTNTYEHVDGGQYCFNCKKDIDDPEPGWFWRQVELAKKEDQTWPEWSKN